MPFDFSQTGLLPSDVVLGLADDLNTRLSATKPSVNLLKRVLNAPLKYVASGEYAKDERLELLKRKFPGLSVFLLSLSGFSEIVADRIAREIAKQEGRDEESITEENRQTAALIGLMFFLGNFNEFGIPKLTVQQQMAQEFLFAAKLAAGATYSATLVETVQSLLSFSVTKDGKTTSPFARSWQKEADERGVSTTVVLQEDLVQATELVRKLYNKGRIDKELIRAEIVTASGGKDEMANLNTDEFLSKFSLDEQIKYTSVAMAKRVTERLQNDVEFQKKITAVGDQHEAGKISESFKLRYFVEAAKEVLPQDHVLHRPSPFSKKKPENSLN